MTQRPFANPMKFPKVLQQYADIIAYMFNLTGLPAGENELAPDAQQLNMIIIEPVASKSSL